MFRAEMESDGFRMRRLVEAFFVETNGVSPYGCIALRPHHGCNSRRVDATGKECAERHVRDESTLDRVAEQRFERGRCLIIAEIDRRAFPALGNVSETPVGPGLPSSIGLEVYAMPRRELPDIAVN